MQTRRTLMSLFGASMLASALLSGQARASMPGLDALSAYLQRMVAVEARFEQVNPDHSRSEGRMFIHRPGRMRIDYAGRDGVLVIAQGGSLTIFDPRAHGHASVYPLSRTPLAMLLARDINLMNHRGVRGVRTTSGHTVVHVEDPAQPQIGSLHLIFRPSPIALHGWVAVDDMGRSTRVTLHDLREAGAFPGQAFDTEAERRRRGMIDQR